MYTKGPWNICLAKTGVVVSILPEHGSQSVASVFARDRIYDKAGNGRDVKDNPEGMANARLIAAAPDLVEALRSIIHAANGSDDGESHWLEISRKEVAKAAAALRKAGVKE